MKKVYVSSLAELSKLGVKYAILRQPCDWGNLKDLDIIVEDPVHLRDTLLQLGFVEIDNKDEHAWYARYDASENIWVHFDVNKKISFGDTKAPDSFIRCLLQSIVKLNSGEYVLLPEHEAIILIFHSALHKGVFYKQYKERIYTLTEKQIHALEETYSFLPKSLCFYYDLIRDMNNDILSERQVVNKICRSFNSCAVGSHKGWFKQRFRRVFAIPRALLYPKTIAFVGPDGVGKTTVTTALCKLPFPSTRRQYMGIDNPSEMSKLVLLAWKPLKRLMDKTSKYSAGGVLVRIAIAFVRYIDFYLRIARHWCYLTGKRNILILDRYPCDVYFRIPKKLNELLFLRFFRRPSMTVVLTGAPQVIHSRKTELTAEEIEATIGRYRRKLCECKIPYRELDTTSNSVSKVINLSLEVIVKYIKSHD